MKYVESVIDWIKFEASRPYRYVENDIVAGWCWCFVLVWVASIFCWISAIALPVIVIAIIWGTFVGYISRQRYLEIQTERLRKAKLAPAY